MNLKEIKRLQSEQKKDLVQQEIQLIANAVGKLFDDIEKEYGCKIDRKNGKTTLQF